MHTSLVVTVTYTDIVIVAIFLRPFQSVICIAPLDLLLGCESVVPLSCKSALLPVLVSVLVICCAALKTNGMEPWK